MKKILRNPVDFDNAILFGLHIEVWQQGELLDYGGVIRGHNEDCVYINEWGYFKNACEFRVK